MAEATVLATIRQEIDKAVKKRERYKNLVNGKKEILNSLKEKINDCIRKVSATSFENKSLYIDKLRATVEKIDKILEDAAPLINRFNRDTINLGVAGATQAGKSTFLETLSGVKLPRAKEEDKVHGGDSTTAAKSIIINSNETKVTVHFRTKDEFVKNVQAYLPEKDKAKVSDIVDFERLPLDEIMLATTDANERTEISRLIEAQQAFVYNKNMLGESPKEISVQDIPDYVTYYQGKDNQHRFWSVVKLVEIRCPFVALGNNDIKLTLVDLPGMGESPRVDKQMVDELENEVDTVLLFFKSNAVTQVADNKAFDKIKDAQKFIMDKTKFLSFLINVRTDDTNPEGHICTIQNRINNIFQHSANEKYKVYITKVFETDKVHQDVVDVLTKLVGDIDSLDSDTYNGWISQLDVTVLKKQVNEIANQIKDDLPYSPDDEKEFDLKKNAMIKSLAKFNSLEDEYKVAFKLSEVRKVVNAEVQKIYEAVAAAPLDNPNWDIDFADERETVKGVPSPTNELIRLWTFIRREYRAVENVAEKLFSQLKSDILMKFNELVGKKDFISQGGDEGIHELLNKIADKEVEIPFFTTALESLLSEKISFNQIVYPFVEESKLAKSISNNTANGGLISDDSFKSPDGTTRKPEREHYKNRLIQIVLGVNGEMLSLICDKTPFVIASFLFAKMEYFNDCLNRSSFDDDIKGDCFKKFCKAFRLELWPERFGSSSEAVAAKELSNSINEIIKLINQLNK